MKFYQGQQVCEIMSHLACEQTNLRLLSYANLVQENDGKVMRSLKKKEHRSLLTLSYGALCFQIGDSVDEEGIEIDDIELMFNIFDNMLRSKVSNTKGLTHLYEWMRGVYLYTFKQEVVCDDYSTRLLEKDMVGEAQGLSSFMIGIANWIPRKVREFSNYAAEGIIEAFKKHFDKLLVEYCPIAAAACSWVSNVWETIKEWVHSAIETAGWMFAGCQELMTWGMCVIAGTCALSLLEKALVAMKIISASFDLSGIFVRSAIVGAFCLTMATKKESRSVELMQLVTLAIGTITTATAACFSPSTEDSKQDISAQAQSSGVEMLESLAKSLGTFCDSTLVSVGKTCTAINSINTAVGTMKSLVGKLMSMLCSFVYRVLGLESSFLRDASMVFSENVDGWLKQISWCQDQFLAKAYINQDELIILRSLMTRGEKMRQEMLTGGLKVSPVICGMVNKGCEDIHKLMVGAVMHGTSNNRKIPFVIYAHGPSRVGKTMVINRLIEDFSQEMQLGEDSVYPRNVVDDFWSGYKRQPIVVIDDFGAVTSEPSAEAQLIPLVSSAPYPLNMADLADKGMYFDSAIIMCSSNFIECSPESKVRDEMAFRNRRHVLFSVSLDPNVPYDSEDITKNQIYEIKSWFHDSYHVDATFTNYGDLLAYCKNKWAEHNEEQDKNMAQLKKNKMPTTFQQFSSILDLAMFVNQTSADLLARMKDEEGRCHFISCEDTEGHLRHYSIDSAGNVEEMLGVDPVLEQDLLKKTNKMVMAAYNFLKYNSANNLVIKTQLSELVDPTKFDKNYEFKGVVGDPLFSMQVAPSVKALPKWQRMTLYTIGKCLGREKISWYDTVKEKTMKALTKAYQSEIHEWPISLKITVGVILATVAGKAFWSFYKTMADAGNGGHFVGSVASAFAGSQAAVAQSRKPNRFDVSQYRYRNIPLRKRNWAEGQMSIDQSTMLIMEKCKANFKFSDISCQIVMLPGRQFIGYKHVFNELNFNMYAEIHTAHKKYTLFYKPENRIDFPNSELMLYKDPSLEDIPASCWDLFCFDAEKELPTTSFTAEMLTCKLDRTLNQHIPEWADITVKTCNKKLDVEYGNYQSVFYSYLQYNVPTKQEDCGSIIVATVGHTKKIIGIHTAGRGNREGFASYIPLVEMPAQAQAAEKFFDFLATEHDVTDGIGKVGHLKPGVWVPLPTKTNLVETPVEWHLQKPKTKEPSILSSTDLRLGGKNYDPFVGGIQKYSQPMCQLDDECLRKVATDMVEEWFDCVDEEVDTFEEVDLQAAINGIEGMEYMERVPLSTSEGFPHILSRKGGDKGKKRFLYGDGDIFDLVPDTTVAEAYELLEETCATNVPTLIGIECPKDEKLPLRKIYDKPKTRCFTVLPMEYNLVVRRKFLKFVAFIMKNRHRLSCQVGINPYGMEWSRLAQSLLEKGNNILCCDYSSFDGLLTKQIMSTIADMINELCQGGQKLCAQRKNLLMACCSRYAICKGDVWRVECGIPSGFPLTVICNSIFNEMLVRYSYVKICEEARVPRSVVENFGTFVKIVTYGDDNLISVQSSIKEHFNGQKLKNFLDKQGITITDGKDKTLPYLYFRQLEDCDFLKRGFKQESDVVWVGPEEKESLWAQLQYVTTNNLERNEAYLVNLVNVIRELYLHNPEEAAELRRMAIQRVPFIKEDPKLLPTMAQIKNFFLMQRQQQLADTNDNMDVLLNPDYIFVAPQRKLPTADFTLASGWKLRDLGKKPVDMIFGEERTIQVLFNASIPDDLLQDNMMVVNWPLGPGRGGLPTHGWAQANLYNPRSNIMKRLSALIQKYPDRDVELCFKHDSVPVAVVGVLMMVHLGVVKGKEANVFLTQIIEHAKTLKYLVKEATFIF
ncbi:polyprotein [Comovirus sp.]|nr:polyprotein [Comovirus sp.]